MTVLPDQLYALRPTTVQQRFGTDHRALLLSGPTVARAAAEGGATIGNVDVVRVELLPSILRAAQELDIALQLNVGELACDQVGAAEAANLAASLVYCAVQARFTGPLVLATVVAGGVGHDDPVQAHDLLLNLVTAGFTNFIFPAPQTRMELDVTAGLMRAVTEYGLGVELCDVPPQAGPKTVELFARLGIELCGLTENEAGVSLFVVDGGPVPAQRARRLTIPNQSFVALLARALDVDAAEALMAPIDTFTAEKIEAVAYAEARRLLRRAALVGSGSGVLSALAWLE